MTDREKLIAMMIEAKKADTEDVPFSEFLADFLIANGVTFATDTKVGDKWISVKDRLPEEGVVVMCRHKAREYPLFLSWNESDLYWEDDAWIYGTGPITHWMPLPEPPKEE